MSEENQEPSVRDDLDFIDEPTIPTMAANIIKADNIINKVGLHEVREVYESELDNTMVTK